MAKPTKKPVVEEVKETHENVIKNTEKSIRIRMISFYLGDMGRYEKNSEYEVPAEFGSLLVKNGDAERV